MMKIHSIDWDEINELANQIDIVSFIEKYQEPAKYRGDMVVFHCCRNSDSTPSLVATSNKGIYKCFSCGTAGNALTYLIKERGMPPVEAVKVITDVIGSNDSPISERPSCDSMRFFVRQKRKVESTKKDIERVYTDYKEYQKFSDELPHEWLEEGIEPDVMRRFDIRVDNNSNRIVYPVYDSDGRFICAKGRTRFDHYKEFSIAKYKYYSKIGTTDFFCGLKENYDSIKKHNEVIVLEGIKSVMKLYGWGYDYAVSAETSALNELQIRLLLKLDVSKVTIAFDKDKQYKQIEEKVSMLKRFLTVYVVIDKDGLLDEKDSPCDKGREVFERLLNDRRAVK